MAYIAAALVLLAWWLGRREDWREPVDGRWLSHAGRQNVIGSLALIGLLLGLIAVVFF